MCAVKVKAISPLVAALLLIMVGIAGAVLVYLWLTGFAGKSTIIPATVETQLKIEAAKLDSKEDKVILYVRNVGATTLECDRIYNVTVYVYDSFTGQIVGVNPHAKIDCGDTILEPGELAKVTANLETFIEGGMIKGKYYDIKLAINGIEYTFPSVRAD